jgi:hypothetical protein
VKHICEKARMALAAVFALCAVSVQAQSTSAAQSPEQHSVIKSQASSPVREVGVRIHQLKDALALNVSLPCSASRTIKVIPAVESIATDAHRAVGEIALIQVAATTGRKLMLSDARCDKDGSIVVSSLALEPQPSSPVDLCALPYAKGSTPECR